MKQSPEILFSTVNEMWGDSVVDDGIVLKLPFGFGKPYRLWRQILTDYKGSFIQVFSSQLLCLSTIKATESTVISLRTQLISLEIAVVFFF